MMAEPIKKELQNWALYARHELNTKDCNQEWILGDLAPQNNVYNTIFGHVYQVKNTGLNTIVNEQVEYNSKNKDWKDKTRDHSNGWFNAALKDKGGSDEVEKWWDPDIPGSQHGFISDQQRASLKTIMSKVEELPGVNELNPPVKKTIKGLFTSVTKKVPATQSKRSTLRFKMDKGTFWLKFNLRKIIKDVIKNKSELTFALTTKLVGFD